MRYHLALEIPVQDLTNRKVLRCSFSFRTMFLILVFCARVFLVKTDEGRCFIAVHSDVPLAVTLKVNKETSAKCEYWAQQNECTKNTKYMLYNCAQTCFTKRPPVLTGPVGRVERKKYHEGQDLMFDDMMFHSVENNTPERRVVLFVDFAKPYANLFVRALNSFFSHLGRYSVQVVDLIKKQNDFHDMHMKQCETMA